MRYFLDLLILILKFFTTPPYACDPSSLPKYPPSKEMDAKLRDEEARRFVTKNLFTSSIYMLLVDSQMELTKLNFPRDLVLFFLITFQFLYPCKILHRKEISTYIK